MKTENRTLGIIDVFGCFFVMVVIMAGGSSVVRVRTAEGGLFLGAPDLSYFQAYPDPPGTAFLRAYLAGDVPPGLYPEQLAGQDLMLLGPPPQAAAFL